MRKANYISALLTVALVACGGAGPATTYSGMGALDGVLTEEHDRIWRIEETEDGWVFANDEGQGEMRYFYVGTEAGQAGQREVTVDVKVLHGSVYALAGLLYGYQENPRTYYLFTLGGDGQIHVHHFDQGRFEERMALGISGVSDTARLSIREYGNEIALLVDGEERSRLGNADMGKGSVGIIAADTGRFQLANFSVRTQGSSQVRIASPTDSTVARRTEALERRDGQPALQPVVSSPSAPANGLHLKPISVIDRGAPNGPTEAFRTVIPVDWETQGGIFWYGGNDCRLGPRTEWGVHSPDKLHGIAFLPTYSWSYSTSGIGRGCVRANLPDAEAAARYWMDNTPGLTSNVMEVSRPPELQQMARQLSQQAQQSAAMGQAWADAALLKVRASDGEVETDSYLIAITTHYHFEMPDGWGGVAQNGGGNLAALIAISAPVGQIDTPHPAIPVIMDNYKFNDGWNRQVLNWWAQVNRETNETFGNISKINAAASNDILDSSHNSFLKREGLKDRGQAEYVESIWGTETYATPDGERSFSNAYDQIWRLDDGSFYLTNDNFYQPLKNSGIDGQQMRPNR